MRDVENKDSNPEVIHPESEDLSFLANQIVEVLRIDSDEESTPDQLSETLLSDGSINFQARSYQVEMLEESLKRNIIVAMDTGSGKTHIAVMRILHELDRLSPNQIIWFLAPTVALCSQQFETLQSQISIVQSKFLSGADGVDRWTSKSLWDNVLKNIRIVVCTYQILLDGLTHGFIQMQDIALLIFDEAHNCVGKNPGARIMTNFYHPRKANSLAVPHILGLTASPVMKSAPNSLGKIEETLDSICRTPTKHRAELRLQVNRPTLQQIYYKNAPLRDTKSLQTLAYAYSGLDIEDDPYIQQLRKDDTEKGVTKLHKIRLNRKTWCQDQFKSLHATSLRICIELGQWAADYYVAEVVFNYLKKTESNNSWGVWDVSSAEQKYVADALRKVDINYAVKDFSRQGMYPEVSDKVTKLIETLRQQPPELLGIIFVQERAMVAILYKLLSLHPDTRDKYRLGTIVGSSVSSKRTENISELIEVGQGQNTLSLFRSGSINLLIATSVLEEGIDIPACNFVLCFQKPANLKSFVQRRGRARQRQSKLILMFDLAEQENLSVWESLENEMKTSYEDEMRSLHEVLVIEDSEETISREFRVSATNALLDLENAVQHLYHFCSTLPHTPYVNLRPEFICSEAGHKLLRAKVYLPVSVHETVRVAVSQKSWMSERNAIKDAAFEAYLALYKAGLVNDNMLPLLRHDVAADDLMASAVETRASIMVVGEKLDPWVGVARAWRSSSVVPQSTTILFNNLRISLILPTHIPTLLPFQAHWDTNLELPITLVDQNQACDPKIMPIVLDETLSILQMSFGKRFDIKNKLPVALFSFQREGALGNVFGRLPAENINFQQYSGDGLVREKLNDNIPYILKSYVPVKPPKEMVQHPYDNYEELYNRTPHLSVIRLPKRLDFLHRISGNDQRKSEKPYSTVLPITECTIDEVGFKYVQFGLMVPSIMRKLEVYMLASILSTSILKNVRIQDLNLIVTSICASSAQEDTNYQRLEFIGDSVLKLCTSIQLMADFPLWHQGYLSAKKDTLVSNARLSRAAVEIGLDRFIVTQAFTGSKWRPLFVDDLLRKSLDGTRDMSSKVLADVVEALIGAAMLDGGVGKALACLQAFIPEQNWTPLESRQLSLFELAPCTPLPPTLEPLETLIGYRFNKKSLLIEAMSHASYTTGSSSYERSEFLGDSILDFIVVENLRTLGELSHIQMHLLRTALVNADFLAFLCMEWSIEQEQIDLIGASNEEIKKEKKTVQMPLWRFMRHQSPMVGQVHVMTAKRHTALRNEIVLALGTGRQYPWALLAQLQAMKFYSDLVESLLGAIWIDSGSFETCQKVMEMIGILPYLRRVLRDSVDVWHPKERLGLLAVDKTVKYTIEPRQSTTIPPGANEYACRVSIGDDEIVAVEGGVSKEEVMTKVADAAVLLLTASVESRGSGGRSADGVIETSIVTGVFETDVEMALL